MRPVEPRFAPTSPLYSSSSSSEPPDESYLLPGAIPDTGDPFARFWGMLENMMEEISIPRALTTAVTSAKADGKEKEKEKEGREKGKKDKKDKKKDKDKESPSPSESFYVVPEAEKKAEKTPEELALENASLRASLDALAVHSHAVEKENRELKKRAEERDVTLRSMVLDVQKEVGTGRDGGCRGRLDGWARESLPGNHWRASRATGGRAIQGHAELTPGAQGPAPGGASLTDDRPAVGARERARQPR
jgi:hypothetical protein